MELDTDLYSRHMSYDAETNVQQFVLLSKCEVVLCVVLLVRLLQSKMINCVDYRL